MDLSKLRYHKIVIMTDADVDGAHIRTPYADILLQTSERDLINEGYIYIAQPLYIKFSQERQ